MKVRSLILVLMVLVAACGESTGEDTPTTTTLATATTVTTAAGQATQTGTGTGSGMGVTTGLRDRHQAPIPAPYSGITNPVAADEESLARGAEIYVTCSVCHGETGLGDGAAGAALDPAPVNIAHTSQMMSDAYFFWRITEGGAQFGSSMPAWGEALDEQAIWDVINYVQALGAGSVTAGMGPGSGMGMGMGQGGNAAAQAVQQAALVQAAVDQGIITQAEADVFDAVHPAVDARANELRSETLVGDPLLTQALAELVAEGELTQDEADTFKSVRDRMAAAGLLP